MNIKEEQNSIYSDFPELFDLTREVDECVRAILEEFNNERVKLFDLPAHRRIFLFIITRAVKTFFAIHELCEKGYGQDVSTLLRGLLENLITAQYILHDESTANEKAKRFVAYKWVIFKKELPALEKKLSSSNEKEKNAYIERKELVESKVKEFKENFNVKSDRALVTWSGKTIKDMAGKVSSKLSKEYDTTFRLCSRFSHPSILGDSEYLVQDDESLVFSPLPSPIGIVPNLINSIRYILQFAKVINDLFGFANIEKIRAFEQRCNQIAQMEKYKDHTLSNKTAQKTPKKNSSIRESYIAFKTH